MAKFFNKDVSELAHQLLMSPRRLRAEQLKGIESLLGLVETGKSYPYEFVCYHITKYRKRGQGEAGHSIPGQALVADLVTMAEFLSRKSNVAVAELSEPVLSHQEVAGELKVSTKTIRRWRNRGLMGLRAVCADGVNRLVFWRSTLDRFVRQHSALVEKGASFTQLSDEERARIIARARELVSAKPMKLHAVAKLVAEETGRAVETVRYTLRRHDTGAGSKSLFVHGADPVRCERELALSRCFESGDSIASIAAAFSTSESDVEQVLRTVRFRRLAQSPPEFIPNEMFERTDAESVILGAPEPAGEESAAPLRVPRDLPPYLRSLYLTPLLSREQEQDLFRRYNYLKYHLAARLRATDPMTVSAEQLAGIDSLTQGIEELRRRIIKANLRLVVSIAKRHAGRSANFFEIVSDGNMSLMRAIEKFDYARGFKFSTYATWAIMKNYARSIPEQYGHASRYVTGQDVALENAADARTAPDSASDRGALREAIETGLSQLDEREREIVRHHFGLTREDQEPVTLEQLGQRFGVTKERVRQIEQKAIARLRELLSPRLAHAL